MIIKLIIILTIIKIGVIIASSYPNTTTLPPLPENGMIVVPRTDHGARGLFQCKDGYMLKVKADPQFWPLEESLEEYFF